MPPWNRGKRSWTEEALRAAISEASSWKQVGKLLNVSARNPRLKSDARQYQIDISHFRRSKKRGWTDKDLISAVENATSLRKVLANLGLKEAGGNYKHVKRAINRLGLNTKNLVKVPPKGVKPSWLPSGSKNRKPLEEILKENTCVNTNNLKWRLIREGYKKAECEICGWAEISPDGRMPIELDHINGCRTDFRLENLRILCPNHHSLTETYRGAKSRRQKSPQELKK